MDYQRSKLEQESFLAKKKAEILARKNAAKTTPSPTSTTSNSSKSAANTAAPSQLPFANDGSFLEKFMAMQKAQQQKQPNKESESSKQASSLVKLENKSTSSFSKAKPAPKLSKPAAIFEKEDQSADEQYISSDYDLAKQLAEKVAKEGPEAEAFARIEHVDDARYRFLFDPTNPVSQYYQKELKLHKESVKSWNLPLHNKQEEINKQETYPEPPSSSQQIKTEDAAPSTSSASQINPLSEFEKAKALMRAKAAAMLGAANPQAAINEEEIKKQKAVEEQKMMNEIYRKVIEQQAAAVQAKSKKRRHDPDKPKYEYDSDEDVDGGTWEHKKRMLEMEKTKEWAMDLTQNAKGKHHLADFLPPEELEKFLEKVQAVREGREADFSDYSKYRIQADNLGYKMLQKAGWEEGKGLGAKGEGIQQPVNKGKVSFDQSGVGAEKVSEVKKEDDDFDLYRKRMMLAYKFRPNPLFIPEARAVKGEIPLNPYMANVPNLYPRKTPKTSGLVVFSGAIKWEH